MSPSATLDAALDEGRLLFLAGSGISRDSGLPSADELLRRTLDLVLPASCDEGIRGRLAGLQPELVYEAIIRVGGDRRCLRLWAALSHEVQTAEGFDVRPNAVHRFLVEYSWRAKVPLVTPNFDVLFELAADDLGIPYRVYLPRDEPPRDRSQLAICKIHGSIETCAGAFDTETIWTTACEIATFNAPWMDFLAREAEGRHWCFVGYSGRDIDLLPHLAGAVGDGPPIIWIDKFDEAAPATPNARETQALCVHGWPSEVLAHRKEFDSVKKAPRPDLSRLLDSLAQDFRHEVVLTAGQQELLHAILTQHAGSTREADAVLDRIGVEEFRAMPRASQIEYVRMRANCHHETSRYRQLGAAGLRMARFGLRDIEALIDGLIVHAESLRMRVPSDTYHSNFTNIVPLVHLGVGVYFVLVAALIGICLLVSRRGFARLSPGVRHAVIEHGIRFLAILQRFVQHRARKPQTLAGRLLRRAWRAIHTISHRHGYAAGMANAGKFLYRIAPEEGHRDAPRIYGLFAHKAGVELLRRNQADEALARGDYAAALAGYAEYGEMALRDGNLLNAVKARLGCFKVRELQPFAPPITEEELRCFAELASQVEGYLWQRHFHHVIAQIRSRGS